MASDIRIAVAFISKDGLDVILPSIEKALTAGAKVEFLIGMDTQATDAAAVKYLYEQLHKTNQAKLFCFVPQSSSAIYHPKMYLAKNDNNATIFIGSSNLTKRGLMTNVEVNLLVRDNVDTEIVSEAYTTYARLKFHPARVIPDDDFIDLFIRLCNKTKRLSRNLSKNLEIQELLKDFTKKARSLQKPRPNRDDLIGWVKEVYDILPQNKFNNQEIYKFEKYFKTLYPQNKNIRAKIRQQLQILRDLKLIEHVGKGTWIRKPS
ncbi:MAG: phospholipase D-like domain-containing protein [Chloracidobacterium sp.]|nr:phospholipase D-like domain-containing protein [Chloracidobacterium sp.]